MARIIVENACVCFPIYQGNNRSLRKKILHATTGGYIKATDANHSVVEALRHINLELNPGDRVGLVGRNGAGKTTLLRLLAGTYEPVTGTVVSQGKITPMFDIGLGIDPESTGYENIMIRGLFMGMSRKQVADHIDSIAEFAGLGEFLNMPVRTYSSGMSIRLAFAVSTCMHSEILLMDEWIMAGDAAFMEQANKRLGEMVNQSAILVLASHSDAIIRQWCNKVVWMERGEIRAFGPTEETLALYNQSY